MPHHARATGAAISENHPALRPHRPTTRRRCSDRRMPIQTYTRRPCTREPIQTHARPPCKREPIHTTRRLVSSIHTVARFTPTERRGRRGRGRGRGRGRSRRESIEPSQFPADRTKMQALTMTTSSVVGVKIAATSSSVSTRATRSLTIVNSGAGPKRVRARGSRCDAMRCDRRVGSHPRGGSRPPLAGIDRSIARDDARERATTRATTSPGGEK